MRKSEKYQLDHPAEGFHCGDGLGNCLDRGWQREIFDFNPQLLQEFGYEIVLQRSDVSTGAAST
jgi:hypothetical protein